MNTVTLTGRLTQDPKVRSAGELEICDVRLAVPRRRASDGSDKGAVYIDVTAFGGLAKTCGQYLAKGRRAADQPLGEVRTRAQRGTPHPATRLVVPYRDTVRR